MPVPSIPSTNECQTRFFQWYQSIINQQSLPNYLLNSFCSHGASYHYNFSCMIWTPTRVFLNLFWHGMIKSLQKLIKFSLYPRMYFTYPKWHLLLDYNFGAFAGLTLSKFDGFDYVECIIPATGISKVIVTGTSIQMFVDTKGQFVYLTQVTYHLPSSELHIFSPQVFYQRCGEYNMIFEEWVEVHLTNEN